MKQPLIILAGPTASGKTSLSIALAKRFNMEIIVDENGNLRMEDGSITYPSLQKWEAHRQAHPEDELR